MDGRVAFIVTAFLSAMCGVGGMLGCSQGGDIPLAGRSSTETPPAPSATPPTAPSSGTPVSDTSNTANDSGASTPVTPVSPVYRIFCDDRYPLYVKTISSLASPTGFAAELNLGEAGARGRFDPILDHNLEEHAYPQVAGLTKNGVARILFSARRASGARFIFLSEAEIAARGGIAKPLGREVVVAASAQNAAARENVALRTFGVSDQGHYLLIGDSGGYRILEAATQKLVGTIAASATSHFNPGLRESDMIFSVATIAGGVFKSKLYSLGISGGRLTGSRLISTTSDLRRPLLAVGPQAGESFGAVGSNQRLVLVSPLRPGVSRIAVSNLPSRGRLSSAAAFWRESLELRAVIIFENFVPFSKAGSLRYKIEQVFGRVLSLDESTLSSQTISDETYPPESAQRVADGLSGSAGGPPGVSEFTASPDGHAIFALFPGELASQLYRLTVNGFERVSQSTCTHMSMGVEP